MGDPGLRCTECAGKLGRPFPFGKCELCFLQGRIRDHLLSPRFPPEGIEPAVAALREALHRILDVSDSFWGLASGQGGVRRAPQEQPDEEKRKEPEITAEEKKKPLDTPLAESHRGPTEPESSALNLAPKFAAKPPEKIPVKVEPESDLELEEPGAASGSRRPSPEVAKERKQKSDKKDSRRSRSRTRHKRRRRTSGEKHSSPRDKKKKKEESDHGASGRAPRPSRRPSERRGSPLRPRSPSHPPYRRWEGPIPAGGGRDRSEEPRRGSSPKYTNKGVKKRYQQARIKGKGKGGYWIPYR